MKEMLKRELNKTYLVLVSEGEAYEEGYELEMILRNAPKSLLPLRVLRVDGEVSLYYEVSARQSLSSCAEGAKLSGRIVRLLFETIEKLLKETEDYLLEPESILLDLDHVYLKEEELSFCYCPWHRTDVLTALRELLEGILGALDYHDTEGVALTYHLYQESCKGTLCIEEVLMEHRAKSKEAAAEPEETRPEVQMVPELPVEEESAAWDLPTEEEPVQKTGFLNRIVSFFMKKEAVEELALPDEERESSFYEYPEFIPACEINETCEYTRVLEPAGDSTVLLEDMPVGTWRLRPLAAGYEEFVITAEHFTIGKKKDLVDGVIRRESVSRIHSRLYVREGRLFLADANSTNGTFVNGTPVAPGETIEIFAGDRILFADVGYECYNSL